MICGDLGIENALVTCDETNLASAAEYRQLLLSYSGTQMMTEQARDGLLNEIENLINAEFDGTVTRPLVVTLTTAVRPS